MKSNLDKYYKVDETSAKEGVDFLVGDASFRVLRFDPSNPKIKSELARHHKPYAHSIQRGTLPQAKEDEIYTTVFVNSCLASWKGVKDEKGADIPFTKENAIKLLMSLPQLRSDLIAHASDFDNYKADLGNS